MSELDAKLNARVSTKGRARCSFRQLSNRWAASMVVHGDDVRLVTMGGTEVWHRVAGSGLEATFELQEVTR